jgi:branched-chain amino acid aminotransferase
MRIGGAQIDWANIGFDYCETNCHVKYNCVGGEWGKGEIVRSPQVTLHVMSGALHYGQAIFEGLKVFHQADGSVVAFNPSANWRRMGRGCARFGMPCPSEAVFLGPHWRGPVYHCLDRRSLLAGRCASSWFAAAIEQVVRLNCEFIPPHGSGGALYVRPIIFGEGAKLSLGAAPNVCRALMPSLARHCRTHALRFWLRAVRAARFGQSCWRLP